MQLEQNFRAAGRQQGAAGISSKGPMTCSTSSSKERMSTVNKPIFKCPWQRITAALMKTMAAMLKCSAPYHLDTFKIILTTTVF